MYIYVIHQLIGNKLYVPLIKYFSFLFLNEKITFPLILK